jgi:hypothetical protein
LRGNRPIVEIQLVDATSVHMVTGSLLADTGAGSLDAPFELILGENDCERYLGLRSSVDVRLGGAIVGSSPIYALRVRTSALSSRVVYE